MLDVVNQILRPICEHAEGCLNGVNDTKMVLKDSEHGGGVLPKASIQQALIHVVPLRDEVEVAMMSNQSLSGMMVSESLLIIVVLVRIASRR